LIINYIYTLIILKKSYTFLDSEETEEVQEKKTVFLLLKKKSQKTVIFGVFVLFA